MKRGPYKKRPTEGTIALLVQLYRASPRYAAWSPGTAKRADKIMDTFARINAGVMVQDIRRGDMLRARDDDFRGVPGAANYWLKIMRGLFAYAVDLEWIDRSPCETIKPLPPVSREGFATWSEDDIDRFLAHWPPGTVARRAVLLMLYTGAARADAVRLGWQNVTGERIEYRRVKMAKHGGPLISVPILPELAAELASVPRDWGTFLQTVDGRPRSAASLTEDMRRWTESAGLPAGRSAHGLRKAMGRRLAEAGCSPHEIMSVLGHESIAMAALYSRAYDRARAAEAAAERLANISPGNVVRLRKKPAK